MLNIIVKAAGLIAIIILGFCLKTFGICKREHGSFLSVVIMNITLPCALLSNVNNLSIDFVLMMALLIGLGANLITNFAGFMETKGEKRIDRALAMVNMSGFNIGTFALPFIQSFFPASSLAYICMFDTGNSMMCLGGTYTLASIVAASDSKPTLKEILKKLFSSIPFCTYIVLFTLNLFHIVIPDLILSVTSVAGNANSFLAMLYIGIMLEVHLDLSDIKTIKKLLISRYVIAVILALCVYLLLPFEIVVKKMLVLILFAPVSGVAPVFSEKLGSDSPVPAAINSLSIIISITIMTTLIVLFM